jgi:hypothetical protein
MNDRGNDRRGLLHGSRGNRHRGNNRRTSYGRLAREVRLGEAREIPRQSHGGGRAAEGGQPDEPDRKVASSPLGFLIHAQSPGGGDGLGDVVGLGDGECRGVGLERGVGDGDAAAAAGGAGGAGAGAALGGAGS